MKRIKITIGLVIFIVSILLVERFVLGGDEDTWICENGEWVKHGEPMIAKPNKGCGGEPDEISKILADLKQVAKGDFSQITGSEFKWRIEGERNGNVIKTEDLDIQGKIIESGELSREQTGSVILYFSKNGFSKSLYNVFPGNPDVVGGYQKGEIVCLVEQMNSENNQLLDTTKMTVRCGMLPGEEDMDQETEIANPAAVYCIEQGGSLRYEEVEAGTRGICTLEDGTECDEWEYFRGNCIN